MDMLELMCCELYVCPGGADPLLKLQVLSSSRILFFLRPPILSRDLQLTASLLVFSYS